MSTASRLIAPAAALLCVALFATPAAAAVSVPITLTYEGTFGLTSELPDCTGVPVTDTLTGTGSHLGLFTATYPHCVDLNTGQFAGTATFTAANGDELVVDLAGVAPDPTCRTDCDIRFETGTITGGTGRFEGAEGTLAGAGKVTLVEATLTGTVTATLEGTINKDPAPF
jgi:hypothetical protein